MNERSFRYLEIADRVRSQLRGGAHPPGGLLPSESELSSEHGASRVTVRRALETLRSEGLVESRQGFGWFVPTARVRQNLDALDTIEQQLADRGMTSERRVLDFGFVATPSPIVGVLSGTDVLEVRRLNLADGDPFALVTVWCRADVGSAFSRHDVEDSTFFDLLGDDLGSADQTIGAVSADEAIATLLEVPTGSPLLRVYRVTADRRGQPVLVSEHHYPAHRTEFHLTMSGTDGRTSPLGLRLA